MRQNEEKKGGCLMIFYQKIKQFEMVKQKINNADILHVDENIWNIKTTLILTYLLQNRE